MSDPLVPGIGDHPVALRIRRPGPKRVLAIDGGGLRGILALAFLKRIETVLRERYGGHPEFRLRDHFDLIGGTSTGAIIATGLALGRTADELIEIYRRLGRGVFARPWWRLGLFGGRLSRQALDACLQREIGDRTLGSRDLTCALVIVAKRLGTSSVWVVHNNPYSLYYDPPRRSGGSVPNKDFSLHKVLRASTAAPTYLEPELIEVAEGHTGFFIDGGVSPYSNPSLLLYLVATTPSYGYGWELGEEKLQLISVGTGAYRARRDETRLQRLPALMIATQALQGMIEDSNQLSHMVLQSISRVGVPWIIDREAGAFDHQKPPERLHLTYTRFDVRLDPQWIEKELGKRLTPSEFDLVARWDAVAALDPLFELGYLAADRFVRAELVAPAHFVVGISAQPAAS
jgi:hypothetical protein